MRDLTIQQRRRPWRRRWKIDFVSFQFFSWFIQGALLLKRRGFGLELKRRDRARVLTKIVEFIALPFPFPSKLENLVISRSSYAGAAKKCTKKRDARAEYLFCSLNLLLFWRSHCHRRRSFWKHQVVQVIGTNEIRGLDGCRSIDIQSLVRICLQVRLWLWLRRRK